LLGSAGPRPKEQVTMAHLHKAIMTGAYAVYAVFGAALVLEASLYRRKHGKRYPWGESGVSLLLGAGHAVTGFIFKAVVIGVFGVIVWNWRIYTVPMDTWWAWALLFFLEEFAYYWLHRCSHRSAYLWAAHRVHHSPNEITLATSYRLNLAPVLFPSWAFFLPIVWIGFPPLAVFGMYALNLIYQSWVHTTLIPPLGPIEGILNTPSAHRVHHASNVEYLDKNYGGVLMIYDLMFGTYQAEDPAIEIVYGLVHPEHSLNPLWVAYGGYVMLLRQVYQARNWRERWNLLIKPPGWSPAPAEAASKT
jgi:sterol desaturase/sphingolipid hydroxylase (fatty acid hydroxylase superfamily)